MGGGPNPVCDIRAPSSPFKKRKSACDSLCNKSDKKRVSGPQNTRLDEAMRDQSYVKFMIWLFYVQIAKTFNDA